MATKKSVSKRDMASVKSIISRTYNGVVINDNLKPYCYGQYIGRYHLTTGNYDYMSVAITGTDSSYIIRVLKDAFYNRIDAYRIVSIQKLPHNCEDGLYSIRPLYCGYCDPVIKELFISYLSTCPDKETYDKMLDIKFGKEMEYEDEIEQDEIDADDTAHDEIEDDMLAVQGDIVVKGIMKEELQQRIDELLTTKQEKLKNIYGMVNSYINGMYRNFNIERIDMRLACSDILDGIIRDYVECRVCITNSKDISKYDISQFYVVVRDEKLAESLIYI